MTVLGETRDALRDGVLVVAEAARLLVRHFPALLTMFLLGLACRNAALWAAVLIGRDHAVVASFLVPLAPLSMVVTLVVMLRIAGAALIAEEEDRSLSRRLAVLTSALVPFLAVYTVTGDMRDDRLQFVNESYADEILRNALSGNLEDRSIITVGNLQLILLVVFLVIRLVIDVLDLEDRHTGWGVVQVLVEVTWLTMFATYLSSLLGEAREWWGDRVVVAEVLHAWRTFVDWLGPVADPLTWVTGLFSQTIEQVGPIVLTPMLWLAVGAVVIVGGLPESRRTRRLDARLTPESVQLPSGRFGAKAWELATRRFGDLVDGLRVLLHGGVLPVLTFCLVLPLARLAEWGTALALRHALGPREPLTTVYFSRYLDIVTSAVHTLLVVVLVVAAIDRLLLRRSTEDVDADPQVMSNST